jgi:predicted cupin superfamily sugar epimerase
MGVRIRPTAGTINATLGLLPRPEGGHGGKAAPADVRRTSGARPTVGATLYLLASGERSAWHRVGTAEAWLFHGGDPLELSIATDDGAEPVRHVLGIEVVEGEVPQVMVPAGAWRSARTLGSWTLVGRVAAADDRDEGVELAPAGWQPGPVAATSG